MTYKEMIEAVKEMIRKGEPLHGIAKDIAIDFLLLNEENKKNLKNA